MMLLMEVWVCLPRPGYQTVPSACVSCVEYALPSPEGDTTAELVAW